MTKKIIAFDLDGTLAPSKSPLPDTMAGLLIELLQKYEVCVISGGMITQFHKQLLDNLDASPLELERLHLMPTCGTQYYSYNMVDSKWELQYAENFTTDEKNKIISTLEKSIKDLGYEEQKVYGDVVEDRGSQITFSALGQDIVETLGSKGVELKEAWDPDGSKKATLRDHLSLLLPDFEVRAGGSTSIDITKPGIDKAYGIGKLIEITEVGLDEILFIGDRLEKGGNDYPVKGMGVDSIAVRSWHDTAVAVEVLNKV